MRVSLLAGAAVVAALSGPVTAAGAYTVDPPVTASLGTSPFDPCTQQPDSAEDPNFENTEVEPLVAVNPVHPENVIGVFQQDRWFDGGAHGLMGAVSNDGGAHYGNYWARFSSCSGNPDEPPRATDPWVSFDQGGRAYQIGLPIVDGSLTGPSAITTSYSVNGGLTWSTPVDVKTVDDPTGIDFLDK
jgi:hypothetical protein